LASIFVLTVSSSHRLTVFLAGKSISFIYYK
jgi:hypothetical protein